MVLEHVAVSGPSSSSSCEEATSVGELLYCYNYTFSSHVHCSLSSSLSSTFYESTTWDWDNWRLELKFFSIPVLLLDRQLQMSVSGEAYCFFAMMEMALSIDSE